MIFFSTCVQLDEKQIQVNMKLMNIFLETKIKDNAIIYDLLIAI